MRSVSQTRPLVRCHGRRAIFLGCASAFLLLTASQPSAVRADQTPDGWMILFDGSSTEHWRGFRQETFPTNGWRIDAGALRPIEDGKVIDLITRKQYGNFELELEWRVDPKGNGGIFLHVSEDYPEVWHSGPEVQVLDDLEHPDAENPKTSAGSIYDLVAPTNKVLRPVGEYNNARFRVVDGRLEHWLNDVKILDVNLHGDEFRGRVAASKFDDMPGFGVQSRGHVSLQHASVSALRAPVWYRNIRIRALP